MPKAFVWLLASVTAAAVIVWWMTPTADEILPAPESDISISRALVEIEGRVRSLELMEREGASQYADLAERLAVLEQEVARASDALVRIEELVTTILDSPTETLPGPPRLGFPNQSFDVFSSRLQAAPGSLSGVEVGPEGFVIVEVTGTTSGSVWGTNIYTDDSSIAAAAVHFGILQPEETGTVVVWVLPGRDAYEGSSRNGVDSMDYGEWGRSYSLQRLQ